MGDPIDTTQQVAQMLRSADTHAASPTSAPILFIGAHCRPTKLYQVVPAFVVKPAAVTVAVTWQSFVGNL